MIICISSVEGSGAVIDASNIDVSKSPREPSDGSVAKKCREWEADHMADISVMTFGLPKVRFTPESGHHQTASSCPLSAKSRHQALPDFRSCSHQIMFCRAALQSPSLSKAFRPSTALKPAHRAEDFGKCLISPEVSSDTLRSVGAPKRRAISQAPKALI